MSATKAVIISTPTIPRAITAIMNSSQYTYLCQKIRYAKPTPIPIVSTKYTKYRNNCFPLLATAPLSTLNQFRKKAKMIIITSPAYVAAVYTKELYL
jgi:hypothetical protein